MTLQDEATELTRQLKGKALRSVRRYHPKELVLDFTDGLRLYISQDENGLDFAVERHSAFQDFAGVQPALRPTA
jgi:hypothetical protein